MNIGTGRFLRDGLTQAGIESAFRRFAAGVVGGFSVEHKEDGTHAAISAPSVSVIQSDPQLDDALSGSIVLESEDGGVSTLSNTRDDGLNLRIVPPVVNPNSRTAQLTIIGEDRLFGGPTPLEFTTTIGRVSGGSGTGASGTGIDLDARDLSGGKWAMIASDDNYNESLGFYDTANAVEVLKLYRTGASTYLLSPSEDGLSTLKLGERTDSDLTFDECAAFKFYERNDAGLGYYTSVAFNAANFTASAGAWTVIAANQADYAYTLVGKKMTLMWDIASTNVTVGGTLRLAIPAGKVGARTTYQGHRAGNAGAFSWGMARVIAGATYVELFIDQAGTGYAATAGSNAHTQSSITFEVQ